MFEILLLYHASNHAFNYCWKTLDAFMTSPCALCYLTFWATTTESPWKDITDRVSCRSQTIKDSPAGTELDRCLNVAEWSVHEGSQPWSTPLGTRKENPLINENSGEDHYLIRYF